MTSRKVELARSYLGNWRKNKELRRRERKPWLARKRVKYGSGMRDQVLGGMKEHGALAAMFLSLISFMKPKAFSHRRQAR